MYDISKNPPKIEGFFCIKTRKTIEKFCEKMYN